MGIFRMRKETQSTYGDRHRSSQVLSTIRPPDNTSIPEQHFEVSQKTLTKKEALV